MTSPRPTVADLRVTAPGSLPFVASATPALSWRTQTEIADWVQSSALITIRRDGGERSVTVDGAQSLSVAWPDEPLAAYERALVRVSVRGTDGSESEPSPWTPVNAAVLTPADWTAPFIAGPEGEERGVTRFRRELDVSDGLTRATLSVTAHGVVDLYFDGEPLSDDVLSPGWTSYNDRLLVLSHDVTDRLSAGSHLLGASVAEGWFGETFGFDGDFSRTWHGPTALSVQLRLEYNTGDIETFHTDEGWTSTRSGPVRYASIYQGERYDARQTDTAFVPGGTDFADAEPARIVDVDTRVLQPMAQPPVR
ncbi:MAG: alpha-L-rhamnosidase N-terminal domain-containing protein, partial [Mycetocola sp.]